MSHLSAAPMDPYQWRESVLSTRSLSSLSVVEAFGTAGRSRSGSLQQPTRRSTMHDDSEDLVMANTGPSEREDQAEADTVLSDIPELPTSVAHSALFALPRELRDRIYTYVLSSRDSLPVEWPRLAGTHILYALTPALLRTCRIIHSEAAPLLYSLNTLTFHHPSDANIFARAYASPALCSRYLHHLAVHMKAPDTRLWMPYLTSTDPHRSLKADFPNLKELGVRYRSNRWNHTHTTAQNLADWREDGRLDELIDGLRQLYFPTPPPPPPPYISQESAPPIRSDDPADGVKPLNEMSPAEFLRFVDARKPGEDMAFKRQLLELHKAHVRVPEPPRVRVVCACRVNNTHFNQLTTLPVETDRRLTMRLPLTGLLGSTLNGTVGAAGGPPERHAPAPEPPAAEAVREGEPFRGFSPIDFLSTPVKRLHDPDLGTAKVARTPFADRDGIGLALEIHCLDSRAHSKDRRPAA